MPVNTGAVLLITLLPAALYMTVNYISGDELNVNNSTSFNYTIDLRDLNRTTVINLNPKGIKSDTFNHNPSVNVNPNVSGDGDEPDISNTNSNSIVGDEDDLKDSSVVKKSVGGGHDFNSNSNGGTLGVPYLPTCCDLRVKKNKHGGRQILNHCATPMGQGQGAKEPTSVWELPKEFLLRKDGVKIFRLDKRRPLCRSESTGQRRSLSSYVLEVNKGNQDDQSESASGDHFLPNGILKFRNEYYNTNQYCINGFKDANKLEINLCKTNCLDPDTPCVQKCCELDEIYSLGMNGKRGGCLQLDPWSSTSRNESHWTPVFYERLNKRMNSYESSLLRPHIIHKSPQSFKPSCEKRLTTVYPYGQDVVDFLNRILKKDLKALKFQMRKDGWLMHADANTSSSSSVAILKQKKTMKYCIDGVQNYGEKEPFRNEERQTVLFACAIPDQEESDSSEEKLESSASSIPIRKSMRITSSTSTSTSTTSTTTTQKTTTTTTTPKPIPIPKLPTCCNLDPGAGPGGKLSHYCMGHGADNTAATHRQTEWTAAPKFMSNNKEQRFKLESHSLKCREHWTKAFILNYDNLPGGGSPSLLSNGMLKFQSEFFQPGEFCVNGIFSSIVEVLMCKPNCSNPETPCINKCCGPNEMYSLGSGGTKRGCVQLAPEEPNWSPILYEDMNTPVDMSNMLPHLVQKFPPKFQYNCFKNVTLVFPYKKDFVKLMAPLAKINLEFKVRKDGKVIYRHPHIKDGSTGKRMENVFNNVEYCVDGVKNFAHGEGHSYSKKNEEDSVLFVCAMNPPS